MIQLIQAEETLKQRIYFFQDGRVERCALTPSCENTGITTNC